MKFQSLGWVVAGLMGITMLLTGFQAQAPKFGFVDLDKLIREGKYRKKMEEDYAAATKARVSVLQFLGENRLLSAEDAEAYAAIAVKPVQSESDKTTLSRITNEATRLAASDRDLSTKTNPTEADQRLIADFGNRRRAAQARLNDLNQQFRNELQEIQDKSLSAAIDRARAAVKEVAQKQGYTVVLTSQSAAYASNDLTSDVMKALDNAKN